MLRIKTFTLSIAALLLVTGSAVAVPITASETITDPAPFELGDRDLERVRQSSNGILLIEGDDSTIISENSISSSFGILNTTDVSYQHNLQWLDPAVDSYLTATLTISAFGNIGGNDIVITDNFTLGPLNNGSLVTLFFSNSSFSSSNPAALNALLLDGILSVSIDKNQGAGFLGSLNALSVFSSSLEVSYEPVPEPMTLTLLGAGLLGASRLRKRS